jgi:curved DNA-binding protein CbpA
MKKKTLYEFLGVEPEATREEIKAAALALVRKFHPAKYPGNHKVVARFKKIRLVYNILANPQKRAAYDAILAKAEMKAATLEQSTSSNKTSKKKPKKESIKEWLTKSVSDVKVNWLIYLSILLLILGITAYLWLVNITDFLP